MAEGSLAAELGGDHSHTSVQLLRASSSYFVLGCLKWRGLSLLQGKTQAQRKNPGSKLAVTSSSCSHWNSQVLSWSEFCWFSPEDALFNMVTPGQMVDVHADYCAYTCVGGGLRSVQAVRPELFWSHPQPTNFLKIRTDQPFHPAQECRHGGMRTREGSHYV